MNQMININNRMLTISSLTQLMRRFMSPFCGICLTFHVFETGDTNQFSLFNSLCLPITYNCAVGINWFVKNVMNVLCIKIDTYASCL